MGHYVNDDGSAVTTSIIPIVDFGGWDSASLGQKRLIAAQLIEACQSIGFVYIRNHKIPPARIAEAFSWSQKLFDLSSEEKKLAPHPDGSAVHRGYSWPGLEKVTNLKGDEEDAHLAQELRQVADVKESYEIGSETYPEQPNVWLPEHILPGFRAFMTDFYWECHENAKMVLRALAVGIGLSDEEHFFASHSGHHNQLRLLHYPPIAASKLEDHTRTRLDAHTDWGSFTMVFQDDCGGLQIENPHKAGEFIDAPPVKDAIVMNIGDLLQRWTNDTLKSSLHRVTPPTNLSTNLPTNLSTTTNPAPPAPPQRLIIPARYSIPYFVAPALDTIVTCLPQCTHETRPAKHAPILWKEYMLMRASMNYER